MSARDLRTAYLAWAAVCFFWGTTYLAMRVGVQTAPPMLFNGLRVLAAGVLLLGWLRFRGVPFPVGREWLNLAAVGMALLGIGNGMVALAVQWVPSGMAALLVALTPFWMIGFEALTRSGERITGRVLVGLGMGIAGLAVLAGPEAGKGTGGAGMLAGFVALQVACASWAAGSIYSRKRPVAVAPLMGAAVQMVAGGVSVVVAGTLAGEWGRMQVTPQAAVSFLYLLFFGSIVGYSSYIYALQKLPVGTVSLYAYINPIIAVVLGWAILREPLSWREAVAIAVILGGVAVVKSAPAVKREKQPEPRLEPACESASG